MFQPFRLGGLDLANRVVVSPMDMYSARDGVLAISTWSTWAARRSAGRVLS